MSKSPIVIVSLRARKLSFSQDRSGVLYEDLRWGDSSEWGGRVALPNGFVCDMIESNSPVEGIAYLTKLSIEREDGNYGNPILHGDGMLDARTVSRLGIAFGPCEPNTFLKAEGIWSGLVPPMTGCCGMSFFLSLLLRGRIER